MTDRYENIRKALAMGPTPGPWAAHPDIGTPVGTLKIAPPIWGTNTFNVPLIAAVYGTGVTQPANAAHIAACDPDTIRALLVERDALRAERDELAEQLRLATIAEALAEAEANDAVIAAAPDLLALAKAYASECEICGGSGRLRGDGWQKPCDACADIRAVISRAEGRSDE